jgi:BASS family bile acid:Na+ symporter
VGTDKFVPVVLQLSIVLVVIALGLKASSQEVLGFWRRPGLVLRSLLALNVIVPAIVIAIALVFKPARPVSLALVLLALSPVPPFLPTTQFRLSTDRSYIYGLLVTSALVSLVYVPALVALIGALTHKDIAAPGRVVWKVVLISVIVPLAVGAAVRRFAPAIGQRIEPFVRYTGLALLIVAVAAIIVETRHVVFSLVGDGTVLIIAFVIGLALFTGHQLGGPDPEDRVVLALASAARHPGVAYAVAAATIPDEPKVGAAILLYLLLTALFRTPYVVWWKRTRQAESQLTKHPGPAQAPSPQRRSA